MGKFKDNESFFKFGTDKDDGSFRQDRYDHFNKESHEHSWSKTSTDGANHKEGWHGNNSKKD